jgi:hypothetical protein
LEKVKLPLRIVSRVFGTIEERFRWKWLDNKAAERISKFVETDSTSPWLEVRKERRDTIFSTGVITLFPLEERTNTTVL